MKERAARRDLVFGLLGAASLVGGIFLADAMFDDATVTFPEPEAAFVLPLSDTADVDDPGAVLTPVLVPVPEPLFEEATVVYPTIYDEEGIPAADDPMAASQRGPDSEAGSGGGAPAGAPGGGSSGKPLPPPADTGPAPGAAGGESTATVIRFLDLCAESLSPACPGGIGATVLFGAALPPLQIEVLTDATTALFPALRCDPGWPSQTVIPVALLSNRPFSLLHVRLKTGDGATLLDEQVNLRSSVAENDLYDQRVKASQLTAPTLGGGVHTCLELQIDRAVNTPPERNGPFELSIQGYARKDAGGDDYLSKTVKFTSRYDAVRPVVRILPLDENRAYLIVPQLVDDSTVVWVSEDYEDGFGSCAGTPPQLDPRSVRRSPTAAPVQFSGLDAGDYPWDRSYSHYTLWDLELANSTDYTLCVRWINEARTDEWVLETPDGVSLTVYSGDLRHTSTRVAGTLLAHIYGAAGCFVANPRDWPGDDKLFPFQTVYGDGTYDGMNLAYMCRTWGRRLGPSIELRALFPDGSNEVYGIVKVPTATLIAKCGPGNDLKQAPCSTALEWRNQRVLCGGGLSEPSCQGDLWFSLGVTFEIENDTSNNRPDPQNWGIFKIARLGEQSDTVQFP